MTTNVIKVGKTDFKESKKKSTEEIEQEKEQRARARIERERAREEKAQETTRMIHEIERELLLQGRGPNDVTVVEMEQLLQERRQMKKKSSSEAFT